MWRRDRRWPIGDPIRQREGGDRGVATGFVVRLLEIGRDYVLALRTDDMDIEYVEVYELDRGG
jgi:hypothetical protein